MRRDSKFGIAKGEYEGVCQRLIQKNDDEHDRIERFLGSGGG